MSKVSCLTQISANNMPKWISYIKISVNNVATGNSYIQISTNNVATGNSFIQISVRETTKDLTKTDFINWIAYDISFSHKYAKKPLKSYNLNGFYFSFERRERDSNPRKLTLQRFSRPPRSTTLPSLLGLSFKSCAKIELFFWIKKKSIS